MNKRILINRIISVITIVILICFCTAFSNKTPEDSVNAFFKSLKGLKIDNAISYTTRSNDVNALKDFGRKKVIKKIFTLLNYKIVSCKVAKNEASINLKVAAPNYIKLSGLAYDYMSKAASISKNPDKIDYKAMAEKFYMEQLTRKKIDMVTNNVTLKIVYIKGKGWLLVGDSKFVNSLIGVGIS